jgi:hypothetical protein
MAGGCEGVRSKSAWACLRAAIEARWHRLHRILRRPKAGILTTSSSGTEAAIVYHQAYARLRTHRVEATRLALSRSSRR